MPKCTYGGSEMLVQGMLVSLAKERGKLPDSLVALGRVVAISMIGGQPCPWL